MRVPKQCPNVVRDVSAEVNDSGSVAPSGFLGSLGTIAKVAGPLIAGLL